MKVQIYIIVNNIVSLYGSVDYIDTNPRDSDRSSRPVKEIYC